MAVSKTPGVGKILVKEAPSTAPYPWYEPGGKIVRISGQRVYFTDIEGKERFTHEYAAICDTQEEADELLEFSNKNKAQLAEFMWVIAEEDKLLRLRLSGDRKIKAALIAPAPRVRRAR